MSSELVRYAAIGLIVFVLVCYFLVLHAISKTNDRDEHEDF